MCKTQEASQPRLRINGARTQYTQALGVNRDFLVPRARNPFAIQCSALSHAPRVREHLFSKRRSGAGVGEPFGCLQDSARPFWAVLGSGLVGRRLSGLGPLSMVVASRKGRALAKQLRSSYLDRSEDSLGAGLGWQMGWGLGL